MIHCELLRRLCPSNRQDPPAGSERPCTDSKAPGSSGSQSAAQHTCGRATEAGGHLQQVSWRQRPRVWGRFCHCKREGQACDPGMSTASLTWEVAPFQHLTSARPSSAPVLVLHQDHVQSATGCPSAWADELSWADSALAAISCMEDYLRMAG